jgi:HAE1 family hydrophobic/amphiphilic exporter-1
MIRVARLRSPLLLLFASLCLCVFASSASALTLDQAIALGKQRSLRMEEPRIEHMRMKGRVREAWSNALPQVEGVAAYQRYFKPAKVFFPNPETGEIMPLELQQDNNALAEATLTQPLFTFGRVAAGLRAAYAAHRSQDHFERNTHRAIELEITRRFCTVLLMRDVVEARRTSLAVSDSSLTRARRMRSVGLMSDYDVLRVQVQAANQIPQLQQAENDLRLAELSLFELLGVPLDTTLSVEGDLQTYAAQINADTAAVNFRERDDLQGLRDLTKLYKNVYVLNRNADLPVLAGQMKYQWQWTSDEWDVNEQNNSSSLYGGLSLSWPIWTSGKNYGKAQQAKADWRRAELDLAQAERGAELQLEAAVRSYETAQATEASAKLAVEQAQEARRIAQTKYGQGQITLLEMDAAQLDELIARVALAQATYNRLLAAAETRMALGLNPVKS